MAGLKCKYCGGDVEKFPDNVLGKCTACGSTMTVPATGDPRRIAAHNAGNYYRRIGSFVKARQLYQKLLEEDPNDAEASFGIALCRFGIMYELNPENGRYFPSSLEPRQEQFLEDSDLLACLAHSEGAARLQYEREATKIAQLLEPTIAVAEGAPKDSNFLLKQAYTYLDQKRWSEADICCNKYLVHHPDNAMAWLGKLLAELRRQEPKDLMECTRSFEYSVNYQNALKYADPTLRKTLTNCLEKVKANSRQRETEDLYQKAAAFMKNASTEEQYRRAAAIFARLSGYRDADARQAECLQSAETSRIDAHYLEAVAAAENARTTADYQHALDLLDQTPGWRDTDERIRCCLERMEAIEIEQAVRSEKIVTTAKKVRKKVGWKKLLIFILVLIAAIGISAYLVFTRYIVPEHKYTAAEALLEANRKKEAIAAFQELGDYKDAADRALGIQQSWYESAENMLNHGDLGRAAISFGQLGDYSDAIERCINLWDSIAVRPKIAAGGWYTAALRPDGTAVAVGDNRDGQCEIGSWLGIDAIAAGWCHTVGLRPDGTVVAQGYNGDGRGSVELWYDIVSIAAGQWHTVGLKLDGTVIGIGCENDGRIDFRNWSDIVAISAGRHHTVGLKFDKTVVAVGSNEEGQCNVEKWTNIRSVSAGGSHTVALKEDGTVICAGSNEFGQCQVTRWQNITAVAAGYYHTVGLRADGTVVAAGLNEDEQCEVNKWTDIVAIAAGGWHTVGLKSDGTVISVGRNQSGQCETAEWAGMYR